MRSKPGQTRPDGADAQALDELHRDWGSAWTIGCGAQRWRAVRRDGTVPALTRASAAGLAMALRVSYGSPR